MAIPAQLALFLGDVLRVCRERELSLEQLSTECLHIACRAGLRIGLSEDDVVARCRAAYGAQVTGNELVEALLNAHQARIGDSNGSTEQ